MAEQYPIELWLFQHTDDLGKRRVTRYRLTEQQAKATLREPVKVQGSMQRVDGPASSTSSWLKPKT